MKKIICLAMMLIVFSIPSILHATCDGDCSQYCGSGGSHGYCVDYIGERLNARQSGDAGSWTGNITADEVQADDVAIFVFGLYGHVAVVDSVNGDDITISEWNWSGTYNKSTSNAACGVTDNYGVETSRTISKSTVTRFWRPNYSPPTNLPYRLVGNVAWYPPNKSCACAERWRYYNLGYPNGGMSVSSNKICYDKKLEMIEALGGYLSRWNDIIFGMRDLEEIEVCK